uniref:C2H2-type domain-containing protein n=1 Tax=Dicentrarchus labrax TaxID=13489 RepID=A0A8C4DY82_DICLA
METFKNKPVPHITVQPRGVTPTPERCTSCCSCVHCPLCTPQIFKPTVWSKVHKHLQGHAKRAVQHKDYTIFKCNLECKPTAHFHCPSCKQLLERRDRFVDHLGQCVQQAVEEEQEAKEEEEQQQQQQQQEEDEDEEQQQQEEDEDEDGRLGRAANMAQACGACGEEKWAREQLSGRAEGDLHITVRRRSDGRMRLEMCKECELYHCPFCKPSVYKPKTDYASVWTHVEIHRMRALQHGEFNIHSCHLQCRGERHFHCPYCARTIVTRKHFESHLRQCVKTQSSSTKTTKCIQSAAPRASPAQPATTVGQGAILLLNLTPPFQPTITLGQCPAPPKPPVKQRSTADQHPASPDPPVKPKSTADQRPATTPDPPIGPSTPVDHLSTLTAKPGQISRTVQRKIKCPMCNLYLHKKNLRKHKLRKHLNSEKDITAKDHLRSQCIDSHNGVYAVAKSYQATTVPVHVIRNRSGSTHKTMCEEDRCEVISDFQRRSGLPDCQCPHLQSVDYCVTHASREDLKPAVLEELVASNWFGKEMGVKCLNHRDLATQNTAPLVTRVDLGGSHCLYFSVFEPEASQCCKLGRLFVTYNVKGRLWHCDCSPGTITCLHKCTAQWYLFQTNKELFTSNAKRDAALNIDELMEDSPAEASTEKSPGIVYPRGEEGLNGQIAKYIYNNKRLPSTFPENITQFETHFSKHLVPAETVCQQCPGQVSLTEPVLITNKATVVTLTGVVEDNSTFIKKCPECEMVYRYQEWSEGLHNYNNHIILSLQLCVLLQNTIKNQTADGGVVEVLEQTTGGKSPSGIEVLQAYLHFEALTSHNCPSGVMMDLYRKGVFNMAGIEVKGLPESLTGEANAEEFWDSVCLEIITNGLVARSSTYVPTVDSNLREAAVSAVTTSFTPTDSKRLSKQRTEECHRAVTRYLVKGLHPISTAESPCFREMTETLNPKYHLPSRDQLVNTLIPSWYAAEKKHVIKELLQVSKAAVTCDLWTSFAHEHYLTVALHFTMEGLRKQKVLRTKPVYDAQTDTVVAEQIGGILEEFGVGDRVVAVTAHNAFSMDIAIKKLQFRKLRCFARVLNLAAQKVYTSNTVTRWASNIRAVVVWIKGSSTAQTVLQKKQQLLNLPQHSLVLDVRTRWNSLYLMVERFVEQYAAIRAAVTDPQITQSDEKRRLETPTDDDRQKAEEFVKIMKPLYTSALCVSADKSPTCSQIFPILKKLETHFETQTEDTLFTATLKGKVWADLSTCYKDGDTWTFLQESSAMDPRFKNRIDSEEIWYRVKNAAVRATTTTEEEHKPLREDRDADDVSDPTDQYSDETLPKRPRLSALEELFEEEDRALKSSAAPEKTPSIPERVQQELQLYRNLPAVPTSEDALAWWWERRDTLPLLSRLSNSYLCIQASSTPRERVFSTAGDTISQERSHVLPELVDMQIFLQKNC